MHLNRYIKIRNLDCDDFISPNTLIWELIQSNSLLNCVLHHPQLACTFSSQHEWNQYRVNDSSMCKWDEFCCMVAGKILDPCSHSGIRIAVLPCMHTSMGPITPSITRYWTPLINSATNSFLTTGIRYSVKEECQASSLVRQVQWMIKKD